MALDVVAQLIDDNRLVPPGGTTGQALVKQSDNDGDAIWDDVAGGGGGGSGTVTSVTLTQPAAGLTITNSGVAITTSGTRTFALANDLAALEALSGTNTIYYRSADSVWSAVTIGSSLSFSGGTLNLGTTPALGTPASGDFSTGTFTWPTFNQNTTGTAAIATTVTAANEATDTTCFPLFVTAATGNLGPKTNASLTFNSSTGSIGITAPVVTGTISSPGSGGGASWSITTDGLLTLTGVDDTITLSNGVATVAVVVVSDGGSAVPATNDKAALGTASLSWSDLFLASGAVINFANGNAAITHSSGVINISTGALQVGGAAVLVSGGALGTPSSGTVTNLTGTASININGTVGATTPAAGTFTTLVAGSTTSLLLGTAGSAVGNIGFRNATSGTATLAPPTGALGTYTVTLPNAASTLPIFGQQITFSGPTAARTITLPDANFTVARTDAANTFTGASTITSWNVTTDIRPSSNDGAALGVSGTAFSDIFLASGAVVNFAAGNATITHSSGLLTFNVPISLGTSNAATVGTIELGHASDTTLSRSAAGVLAVEGVDAGTMDIVQSSKSADYTLALTDRSKCIYHPSSDANARTFTIPANASVAFGIGSTISFINDSANSCTIAITSDTLVWTPTGGTGSRTLAQYGVATITKVTSTRWYISGSGLS